LYNTRYMEEVSLVQLVPRRDGLETIRRMIRQSRLALLTTESQNGELHSRPMQTVDTEFDGDVWFFANKFSSKVSEILARPRVNVSFLNPNRYLSLAGRAEVVADLEKKRELWADMWQARFDGPDSPDAVLIRVAAESVQYWDDLDGPLDRAMSVAKMFVLRDDAAGDPEGHLAS
jgi:general stress protein 26